VKLIQIFILIFAFNFQALANPENKKQQENTPDILIELNRLEQKDNNCITYFMIRNNSKHNFTEFKTEMVTFDKDGLINNRILGDFKKIRPQKTVVKLFAMPETKCEVVHKILINDVHSCSTDSDETIDCLNLLKPAYKAEVELFK